MIRINSDWKFGLDQSKLGLIRIENLVSDWFEFIQIVASDYIGLGRIVFYHFSSNEIQNVFRIGSEWLALARIQIS